MKLNFRSLKDNTKAVLSLSIVITVGLAFAGLMVVAFIIFTIQDQLGATGDAANTITNITEGFDSSINLLMVAITIFILALAISALLMLRQQ